jgi:hypothetical protein
MARKTIKSAALCERILDAIAEGKSLRESCDKENLAPGNWINWINSDKQLFEQYAHAREVRAELLFDEMLDIADETSSDTIIDDNGNEKANSEWIARSRLRVDTRKWALSKMLPKKYGDKLEVDNKGEVGLTVSIINYSDKDKTK